MIRVLLVLGAVATTSCDRRREPAPAPPPPVGSAALADLPDPLVLDWRSLRYDLGSLGVVKAISGRAAFRVAEDDTGVLRASQDPPAGADAAGVLELDAPVLVDLDGDRHEEAVIPFQLRSTEAGDRVLGAFVFALRDGNPVQLGTIPTTTRPGFTIEGATIKTSDGAVWRWDRARGRLVH